MAKKYFENKSQKQEKKENINYPDLFISNSLPEKWRLLVLVGLLALSFLIPVIFILTLYLKYSIFGFPLDDPWIHLQFAKNFIDYGTFSFYKGQLVTSGSTSPIYTLLLAVFYFAFGNEFFISYLLGISFAVGSVYFFYLLVKTEFKDFSIFVIIITALYVIQPKINLIAVSGMETTMFIFLIIASIYFYRNMNKFLLGLFLGFTIWCRPDGFVIWIAILLDHIYKNLAHPPKEKKVVKQEEKKSRFDDIPLVETVPKEKEKKVTEIKKEPFFKKFLDKNLLIAFGLAIGIVLVYFLFNLLLSGSIFPNTYKAKIEYYKFNQFSNFLTNELIPFFTSYDSIILFILFIVSLIFLIIDIKNKHYSNSFFYIIFIIGFVLLYSIKLPFLHRFGRYMMPVIPALYIAASFGIINLINYLTDKYNKKFNLKINTALHIFIAAMIVVSVIKIIKNIDEFCELSKYHNDRHVAAGKWINQNTEPTDIIATHDIGAIGFYGNRKIIDMVGLVTPELIQYINDKNYSQILEDFLKKNKVTYVAVLRNWFEVVNDVPVFIATEEPEILEIFKYQPGKTHFQPREVSIINNQAIMLLQQNNPQEAYRYLNYSLSLDKKSSRTYFLLGAVSEVNNQIPEAIAYYKTALSIFPNYAKAYYGLAKAYFKQQNYTEARVAIIRCLNIKPDFQPALELLSNLPKR